MNVYCAICDNPTSNTDLCDGCHREQAGLCRWCDNPNPQTNGLCATCDDEGTIAAETGNPNHVETITTFRHQLDN